ncbi:bifunctional lysylphosphatidylglycerol flippase/synthetase MprF [uncultured Maricaulis sp.]|uniref:bifunctional lysylphosphatidylglycerol flippase/synthetase MprF n=1 Tax=uncultured Maricaulis sp. TaxID=174710 RepID=UPI0030D7C6DB|tara:strand:+ start:12809 stop:15463 length:2655 start_codon:yes stop_codon:yes gene_type:complete
MTDTQAPGKTGPSQVKRTQAPADPKSGFLLRRLAPLAGLLVFAAALWTIHNETGHLHVRDIAASFRTIAYSDIGFAAALTFGSYLMLSLADWFALHYSSARLPWHKAGHAATLSYAVSNVVGFGPLTSTAVRIRLYSVWGIDTGTVAIITVITAASLYLSGGAVAGVGLILRPAEIAGFFGGHPALYQVLGIVLVALLAAAIVLALRLKAPINWRGLTITAPPRWVPGLQVLASITDWLLSAAVIWILLPEMVRPDLIAFLPLFILAGLFGALSGLPGGIGAFDATLILVAPPGSEAAYVAALVVYRVVYFAGPLLAVGIATAWSVRRKIPATAIGAQTAFASVAKMVAPPVFALLTFLSGAMMLLSAATPDLGSRLRALNDWLPLGVIEASHFAASLAGLILLFLASGLYRRLHRAWTATLALSLAAAVLAILRGLHWSDATWLLTLFTLLALSGPAFYRRAEAGRLRLGREWTAAILATLLLVVWVGYVSYRHIPYHDELWWSFLIRGDESRTLRAISGAIILFFLIAIWRWLGSRQATTDPRALDAASTASLRQVLASATVSHPDSNLALLGDKRFIFSPSGKSFIQYGIRGNNWISMGEPTGETNEIKALLWAFREAADLAGARPIFYAVRESALGDLIDLGLVAQKIGETALISLVNFGIEGPKRAELRQARNRAIRDGASFEILTPDEAAPLMPALKDISDEWLTGHGGAEKGFSLGRFDEAYLANFPIALVRMAGEPIAFANLWTTPDRREFSVDLMRHAEGSPHGVMDYLFTELGLWGKENGYAVMDMGMAPLSGLEAHRLAPLLTRLGTFVYERAGSLYGFDGLRKYKNKFLPDWEPLYLAAPGRMMLPAALGDVALLTSGGLLGLFGRGRARAD